MAVRWVEGALREITLTPNFFNFGEREYKTRGKRMPPILFVLHATLFSESLIDLE